MPLDKNYLLDFLKVLDEEIPATITLVAAGGTAMTLLDLKSSTIDVTNLLDMSKNGCRTTTRMVTFSSF